MAPRKHSSSRGAGRPRERLLIRRARPEDRDAILAMSEKIWGGVDYLPLIWDRWLADPDGALLTATLDGRPVGMSKITLLAPGEVWLEGLRLHPELQGRGLSSNINRATLREAMKLNPKTVRFSTAVINTASRHLAERTGFWQIARTRWMWGRARTRGVLGGRVATPDDLANVWGFAKGSECYERTGGLLCVGWKFPALTRHRLKDLIERGSLLLYPARGKLSSRETSSASRGGSGRRTRAP
jgi:RimJ/RimL family protein N-acetyltransferase